MFIFCFIATSCWFVLADFTCLEYKWAFCAFLFCILEHYTDALCFQNSVWIRASAK
uniref:Uncharacterized protein n=1 Tax=Anguilla anguilla TaxID=7936 RepID=A0A0E9UHX2_ANGAN